MKYTTFLFSLLTFSFLITSCSYTEKIRDGKTAFERKQFNIAAPMLEKEYARAKDKKQKITLALQIAESLEKTGKNEVAIQWYKRAADSDEANVDAQKAYAFSLKKDEQYAEAIKVFKALGINLGSPFEYKKDIENCQNALKWKAARSPYKVDNQSFNSANDDYSATFYAADQLVITSDRSANSKEEKYKWTGKSFSDLYIVDKNNASVKPFSTQINTSANEGTATFNADFTQMIFVRNAAENKNDDQYTKLYFAERQGAIWSQAILLPFCEAKTNYWHPALSADGKTLIFSANGEDGFGGYDLFITQKNAADWSKPKLLPRNINTIGNETFATVDADTLYFSSDFHAGMGGLDIFKTYKIGENLWAQPQNLRAPINSGSDDFSFIIEKNKTAEKDVLQRGFFTSNRKGGQGGDDIYAFQKVILPPLPVDTTKKNTPNNTPKIVDYRLLLDVYVLEKIFVEADNPNSKVVARKGIAASNVSVLFGKENKKTLSDGEGFLTMEMLENTDYQFVVSREGYLNKTATFSTRGIGKDPNNPIQKFELEVVLDKIYKNKEIVLENIYYDYDKWDIRNDAQPTLNKLAQTLAENPTVKIQLNSHTDCRGNDKYNEELSQRRAQSAVDYLISKGIESSRLTAKGYGESVPANTCQCSKCSEEEHQANRRTTFKIE